VNPKVLSATEFAAKKAIDVFLADVMAKPKLFLIGKVDDLEEPAQDCP
jgi:hypothetical protein